MSEWGLFSEDGGEALTFTAITSVEIRSGGKALTEPIEQDGFAAYNKIEEPKEIRVSLATTGSASDIGTTLEGLEKLKVECSKVTLSTPSGTYDSLTLESYNYARQADGGAYALFAECVLKEVREVEVNVTTEASMPASSCKNSGSASKQGTGKASSEKTEEPKRKSALESATGRGAKMKGKK
jgi:hypothetical protein